MSEAVYKLNLPPETFRARRAWSDMQDFVAAVARASGLVADRADLLGELLTGNDLRGVFSHGTRQVCRYARMMRDGELNVHPEVKVLQRESDERGDGRGRRPRLLPDVRGDSASHREGAGIGRGRPHRRKTTGISAPPASTRGCRWST